MTETRSLATLAAWEAAPACLDEIEHIKDTLTIHDSHNAELVRPANGFPVATLAETSPSYAATLDRLRDSAFVTRGLSDAASRPF